MARVTLTKQDTSLQPMWSQLPERRADNSSQGCNSSLDCSCEGLTKPAAVCILVARVRGRVERSSPPWQGGRPTDRFKLSCGARGACRGKSLTARLTRGRSSTQAALAKCDDGAWRGGAHKRRPPKGGLASFPKRGGKASVSVLLDVRRSTWVCFLTETDDSPSGAAIFALARQIVWCFALWRLRLFAAAPTNRRGGPGWGVARSSEPVSCSRLFARLSHPARAARPHYARGARRRAVAERPHASGLGRGRPPNFPPTPHSPGAAGMGLSATRAGHTSAKRTDTRRALWPGHDPLLGVPATAVTVVTTATTTATVTTTGYTPRGGSSAGSAPGCGTFMASTPDGDEASGKNALGGTSARKEVASDRDTSKSAESIRADDDAYPRGGLAAPPLQKPLQ